MHAGQSPELKLLGRPELGATFSKVALFALAQYEQLLYLDADTLPLQSVTELLDFSVSESQILASPDVGWPDIFNSGVFVIRPSKANYEALLTKIKTEKTPSFDGADQGLLNEFFTVDPSREWVRLPFLYNVTPSGGYEYLPAFQFFAHDVRLLHYIGAIKPWDTDPSDSVGMRDKWWAKYAEFFDGDILKCIRGVVPFYFTPLDEEDKHEVVEHPVEPGPVVHQENLEILLDPQSFHQFDTIAVEETRWDPAHQEPPKDGKPEAATFPESLQYGWADEEDPGEDSPVEDVAEEPLPPPLFPWEFEQHAQPERVFDSRKEIWGETPLLERIKSLKLGSRPPTVVTKDADELERLREIEERYTGGIEDELREAEEPPAPDVEENLDDIEA